MPVKLICLDVDGTLVGSLGQPAARVWEAAQTARAANIHLAICTARLGSGTAWEWAIRLDPDGWHQFQTGASIIHTGTGETRSHALPPGAAEACEQICVGNSWVFEAYSHTDYIVDSAAQVAVEHAALLGIPYAHRSLRDLRGEVVRAQFIVDDNNVERAVASAPTGCDASAATSPIIPGMHFVSITAAGVSKASGVADLASLLGIGIEQVMMVGDGQNDVSALSVAGYPVAMGNAHEDAVAVSRYRVGQVDDGAAADAIMMALTLA